MKPDAHLLTPYLLRSVRIGLRATWLTLAALGAYPFVPGSEITNHAWYWSTLGAAAAGAGVVWAIDWERVLPTRIGVPLMYLWSVLDIVLVSILVAVTGGAASPVFVLYALTTLFFAISYPERGKLPLLLFTFASYVVAAQLGGDLTPAAVFVRIAIVGVVAFMCAFLADEMSREILARREASDEAERRANALGAVARAARAMTSLSSEKVLGAVVGATENLGFDAAALHLLDADGAAIRTSHRRASTTRGAPPPDASLIALVQASGKTVALDHDSSNGDGPPMLEGMTYRAAIATPVWVQDRMAGVLTAGTTTRRGISALDRETFELLASQASRALENAQRFEEERAAVERLEELDRLKQEFIDMVSHELRTPLTAIQGMGLTLQRRWDHLDDATRRELLDRLTSNGAVLQDIITTLLDFSRLEEGAKTLDVSPLLVDDLVTGVTDRLRHLFAEGALEVSADTHATVEADPMLLERVVENLVANAAKHTPTGTHVIVEVHANEDEVLIEVRDDGPGIPTPDLARLGERFFRGGDPNGRPNRGTGLGLALVERILSLHHSELSISSTVGEGSRFWFRLPRAPQHAPWEAMRG